MEKTNTINQLTNYIEKVVNNIFSTMIFIEPISENVIFLQNHKLEIPGKKDISGIIGLGGSLKASIIVHFEKDSAISITSKMLGANYDAINNDVVDAVGEVTNMIAGGIKTELAKEGLELDQGLPIVVTGKDFDTSCVNREKSILMPFNINGSKMYIEFSFKV